MAKELCCGDVIPGCDHVMRAETEEEVLAKGADHARAAHGIEEIDEATMEKVKAAIRDV
jgi:predicted small metal-binding protein